MGAFRSKVKIQNPPLGQDGSFSHMAERNRPAFCTSRFLHDDEQGKTLVAATTAWLMIDTEKGKPRRLDNFPVNLEFPGGPHTYGNRSIK